MYFSPVGIKAALEQIGNYYKLHGNKYVVEKDLIKQVLHDRDIDHLVRYRQGIETLPSDSRTDLEFEIRHREG